MRVLVTGASGFVGRRLVPALLEAGHEVVALSRTPDAYDAPDGVAVRQGQLLDLGRAARTPGVRAAYRRLLFGSSIEVVLGVVAFVALVTHLSVYDPRQGTDLLARLLGPRTPLLAVFLTLLVLWDLCYRIGTGWWAAVVALWRSVRFRLDPETAATLRRADRETLGFGGVQLLLAPFLTGHPLLLVALLGHVAAVGLVAGASLVLLGRRERT